MRTASYPCYNKSKTQQHREERPPMMRSRRISLAVKVNVMVIVLVLFVSTVLIMISEHAYREASFKPYIRKPEKITVQEDTLKPGLRYLIPYLNSEKHCFVIGGKKGIRYREYELDLAPGAKLFLYTDGLPEARNAEGEMFGLSRMT